MLMSGEVAAAMVPPPQSLMLKEKGFRRAGRRQAIPRVEYSGSRKRRRRAPSFVEKNPNVAKRFIRAAFEGDTDDLRRQGTER